MQSCLYVGRVSHRRFAPKPHEFDYGLFMVYLDLAELDRVFASRWLWSAHRPALAWFRRADYLGDADTPLDSAVRDLVEQSTGIRPRGALRMLTHLRYFGHCFNPVTFYYCFDQAGDRVETIVAEITSTPWQERHRYVLGRSMDQGDRCRHVYTFAKNFHVSPFMPMDLDYDWRFRDPGERLAVHMNLCRAGVKVFDATLDLRRREMTGASLVWALLRFPFMTLQVMAGIYFQAALLKLKRTPFYDHPPANPSPTRGETPP